MNNPLFSIVIPSFNHAEFIERSILSVLNQNYLNTEIIIIDGGSKDNTVEILKKYSDKITYWESKPDNGQSHALNKGFARANGAIYGWLNSDDLYLPGAFQTVAEIFNKKPDINVVFGDYCTIDVNDNLLKRVYAINYSLKQLIYGGFFLNAQATFWLSEIHSDLKCFDNSLHYTMDYDFLISLGQNVSERQFYRIDQALACFRRHSAQKTRGYDQKVDTEQRFIAKKKGFEDKFSLKGGILRCLYRCKRLIMLLQQRGTVIFTYEIMGIISNKFIKKA